MKQSNYRLQIPFICADFKVNAKFKIGRLPNENVYQLMCHVMRLKAAPHNGTWLKVCDALLDEDACSKSPSSMAVTSRRQDAAAFCLMSIVSAVTALSTH